MNYSCEKCLQRITNGTLKDSILLCGPCAWDKKCEDDRIFMRLNGKKCQKCGDTFLSKYMNAPYCDCCKGKL